MTTALPSTGARLLRAFVLGWALIGGTVAVIKVGQGAPLPSAGGAAGLPFKAGGLFRPDAGGLAAFRAANAARFANAQSGALGFVCTPKMSIQEAINSVSGTKAGAFGRRILLTEGTWDFPATGVTIDRDGIELIALSPGNTFFRAGSVNKSILTITGSWFRVQGITFVDQAGVYPAITVTGSYGSIIDCKMQYGLGILISAADGVSVRDCLFDTSSTGDLIVSGASDQCQIIGNRFLAPNRSIQLTSTAVTNTLIVGNTLAPSGYIAYPPGGGTIASGNFPAENYLRSTFTLADNTVAADVSASVSWNTATVYAVSLNFALYRGATPDVCTGRLDIAINGTDCEVYMDAVTTTTDPGVTFSGVVVAGSAYLQYTTTATGAAATLRFTSAREATY